MPQIQLELGVAPWLGASNCIPGDVFDYYDMPLVGLLKQSGQWFLFECIEGHVSRENWWAYAPVTGSDLYELFQRDDAAMFDGRANANRQRIMAGSDVVVARADNDVLVEFPAVTPVYENSVLHGSIPDDA